MNIEKDEKVAQKNWLREMELEVEAAGREWMRQRFQERLQAEADRDGSVFPPQRTKSQASADGMAKPADRSGAG